MLPIDFTWSASDPGNTWLQVLWFVLIAVLWAGYLVLEGFDFGVGMLLRPLAKSEKERRVIVNTIGPVWDGNEVWLLVAGGATFAAFPEWYATLFSGFYLPLLLILVALIIRGVAFEYRGKIHSDVWRNRWDWAITIVSWVPSILWGVAFGNIVQGVGIDANRQVTYGFFDLLSPYALLTGVCLCLIFLMHGAIFLALKTDGDIRERAGKLAHTLSWPVTVIAAVWALWTALWNSHNMTVTLIAVVVAALALVGVIISTKLRREGWAFVLSAGVILLAVVIIFSSLFPYVMPSTLEGGTSLNIGVASAANPGGASSTSYTLTVMTWVAVVCTPLVLAYQAWTYWVFRKRLSTKSIPEPVPTPEPVSLEH